MNVSSDQTLNVVVSRVCNSETVKSYVVQFNNKTLVNLNTTLWDNNIIANSVYN